MANQKREKKIAEIAGYLREHAKAVMAMPAGEQFIGARDVAFNAAMQQIAEALELLAEVPR